MTDSAMAGPELAESTDPQEIVRIEQLYRERCRPVAEICIVSLPGDQGTSAHLHAVVVPDFALLREQRQPNSRELLRFEFQQVSKFLAVADRPQSFSVRAQSLPRTAGGEVDRERLRAQLLETAQRRDGAAAVDNAIGGTVCRLIGEFRPEACIREDANLELDLDFDSLDRVLLICSVEKTFGVSIPAEQAATILTVGDLIETLAAQIPPGSQGRLPKAPAGPPVALASWQELLGRPLDESSRAQADSILKPRPVLSFLAWGVIRLLRAMGARRFQFRVQGREHLPAKGPYLLVANHCSHLDPLFLLWALPFGVARRLSFMGHTEYFGSGWKAALTKRLKLVPVDPDEHALSGLKICAEALRRNFIGAIFPEGERSPDGAQQRFHRGIALLATQLDLPIIPAAVLGTYEVLPRGRQHIRSAPVQVSFGKPLRAEADETETNLLARAWTAVAQLRGNDNGSREPIPRPFQIESHWCA